jgi:hypothetical protein
VRSYELPHASSPRTWLPRQLEGIRSAIAGSCWMLPEAMQNVMVGFPLQIDICLRMLLVPTKRAQVEARESLGLQDLQACAPCSTSLSLDAAPPAPFPAVAPSPTSPATWCASGVGRQAPASMGTEPLPTGGALMTGRGLLMAAGGAATRTVVLRRRTGRGPRSATRGDRSTGPEGPARSRRSRTGGKRRTDRSRDGPG